MSVVLSPIWLKFWPKVRLARMGFLTFSQSWGKRVIFEGLHQWEDVSASPHSSACLLRIDMKNPLTDADTCQLAQASKTQWENSA